MIRLSLRSRLIATGLACLAGFVDALGFMHLGGYFVSFMSGNFTRMAVGIADGVTEALLPLALIALFVAGVMAATIVTARAEPRPGMLLLGIGVALALAALSASLGLAAPAVIVMPAAMGAMNGTFIRDGEVAVGVTYMTGTLVKLGQRLAAALLGRDRWGWVPYLQLWLGLLVGAIAGAAAYPVLGLSALWLPAAALLALSGLTANRG